MRASKTRYRVPPKIRESSPAPGRMTFDFVKPVIAERSEDEVFDLDGQGIAVPYTGRVRAGQAREKNKIIPSHGCATIRIAAYFNSPDRLF